MTTEVFETELIARGFKWGIQLGTFGMVALFTNEREARLFWRKHYEAGAPAVLHDLAKHEEHTMEQLDD